MAACSGVSAVPRERHTDLTTPGLPIADPHRGTLATKKAAGSTAEFTWPSRRW